MIMKEEKTLSRQSYLSVLLYIWPGTPNLKNTISFSSFISNLIDSSSKDIAENQNKYFCRTLFSLAKNGTAQ